MTLTQPACRATALGIIALTGLCGMAATQKHFKENCTDNSIASFWDHGSLGNCTSSEVNKKWRFHSTGATGALASSGFFYNRYGINWRKDFHAEWDFNCGIGSLAAPRQFFEGLALPIDGDVPTTFTGVAIGVLRDFGGLWIGILSFDGGTITDFDGAPLGGTSGHIVVDWDKSMDRFTVGIPGGVSAHLDGYYAKQGATYGSWPMGISFGIIAANGNMTWSNNNTWIDNAEVFFYSRAF